jgi:hypothetical protein
MNGVAHGHQQLKGNTMSKEIVVLHRGWVVVGDVTKEENVFFVSNASIVRRWGTTKGLGEIALNGPTSNTVLDPCGSVKVHELAVVFSIPCNEEKWN